MIQANAKCIVNGDKVNETIMAVNSLMNVDIVVGNVDEPQVKYFSEGFLIVLPRGSSYANEELYYVDANNEVASRWFVTSTTQASTSPVSTSGTPTGKQSSAPPTSKDRNSLGNTPNDKNRDQLSMNTGGALRDPSGGVAPPVNVTGGALRDDRKVDQFGNTIGGGGALRDDGSTTAGGGINSLNKGNGIAGGMADDGQTAEQSRTNFLANQQRAADTTPAPLPGAPPLGGDTTPPPLPGAPPQISDTTPPPTPVAPPLSGDSGSGDFSPGSRDYRAMQLNNPEAFAAMEQAEKGAMMNDLPTLSSYLQQMGADLKKHNPEKYQALRQREAELNRKLIWDDLQSLNSYLDQRGEDLKKYNNTEYQKLRARQAELSKQATQGRQ